jgi:hypothetical protein
MVAIWESEFASAATPRAMVTALRRLPGTQGAVTRIQRDYV